MENLQILLIAAAITLGVLVVLRWIFTPRPKPQAPAPRAPRAPGTSGAGGAWDGAADDAATSRQPAAERHGRQRSPSGPSDARGAPL